MYPENSKMLVKEIEEDTNIWKDIPCLWVGRINIVKQIHPIPNRLPMAFFTELQKIFKFLWRHTKDPK